MQRANSGSAPDMSSGRVYDFNIPNSSRWLEKLLNPVNHYATVIPELCEPGQTRAVAPFPNWESVEVYFLPITVSA
jgi:hypothetical protein